MDRTAARAEPDATAAHPLPAGGRVLVVRLSALGDVLFALEVVSALHEARPDLRIEFLVEDRFADLLAEHPQLSAVHVYPRRHKLRIVPALLRLRRRRFDVVLDLHGILKSALQVAFLRADAKVGYAPPGAREQSHRLYGLAVPVPAPLPHRADMGHLMLAALGLPGTPAAPRLAVPAPPPGLLDDLPRPRVLLHPGTSAFAAFKRWPAARFAELACRLHERGIAVLVGAGPGEAALAAEVRAAAPAARPVDGAALGLRGLAAVLAAVDAVVAGDTGPLHLAAAVGTPCVALFGPKDPRRYGPRAHGRLLHEILFHDVPCRPCTRRDCVTPQCVLGLAVSVVEAAVVRTLARGRP